jgi:hypothetical protein
MLSPLLFFSPVIIFTITITIYNYSIPVINDNARLQEHMLLVKTPMDTQVNFLKIYLKFWHKLAKRLISPVLGLSSWCLEEEKGP